MKVLYSAKVKATGGRDGAAKSDDGRLAVRLSMPKSLGGPGLEGATNPEQLFAAGYAACFESAIRFVARTQKLPLQDASVEATVSLTPAPTGFALLVDLHVMTKGLDEAASQSLVNEAHKVCPYSNAIRGNIEVGIKIN